VYLCVFDKNKQSNAKPLLITDIHLILMKKALVIIYAFVAGGLFMITQSASAALTAN
jgi:hypothetical protein